MDRRDFLRTPCMAGAALIVAAQVDESAAEARPMPDAIKHTPLRIRPYQAMCVICSLGAGELSQADRSIGRVIEAVREHPDRPIALVCNAGDVYVYQDPGTEDDTPEGRDFNRKRDLDILQRMNWPPGTILPARTLFMLLRETITTSAGICGYDEVTSDGWRGCPKSGSGRYERGHAKGIEALIPPRPPAELAREKEASVAALREAAEVTIRPHILLCAVCQYGGGLRPPYAADNLPELLDLVLHRRPDLRVTMARGADWMMCAPCPQRVTGLNACVNVLGSGGLSNEKRDLDVLQKLGLHFGSTMRARDLLRLIFERIPSTAEICARPGSACPSVWWDGCGESNVKQGNPDYVKGREELLRQLA